MAKRTKKENTEHHYSQEEGVVEEMAVVEVEFNAHGAALKLKLSEISKTVLLKKFPNEVMTIEKWRSKLSKEKINF